MKRRATMAGLAVATFLSLVLYAVAVAQPPAFDRLAPADREEFAKRFEKEIRPLMQRGGKDGCVGCHNGKGGGALRLRGNADKDFGMLLKEGFFLPDDAGSLLA